MPAAELLYALCLVLLSLYGLDSLLLTWLYLHHSRWPRGPHPGWRRGERVSPTGTPLRVRFSCGATGSPKHPEHDFGEGFG